MKREEEGLIDVYSKYNISGRQLSQDEIDQHSQHFQEEEREDEDKEKGAEQSAQQPQASEEKKS